MPQFNSKAKILYIEDNTVQRYVIFQVLKRHGFDVQTALDGQEGIIRAQVWRPDLILMDLGLPIFDGFQAAQILREHPNTLNIPIIAYSGKSISDDIKTKIEAVGMNGLLSKTTSPQELVQYLENYLLPGCSNS